MPRETTLPDVQFVPRPGIIDFGWGHPAADLLPVADLRRAAVEALERDGAAALAYGAPRGPGRLVEPLATRLGRVEGDPGGAPAPEHVLITGGVSQGLDLLCTLLTRPGDVALVESPVYHLAQRILRDHDLRLIPVASDQDGLRLDALDDALARARQGGAAARLLYTAPTFTNPTGRNLSVERRAGVARLAAESDLLVVEDDVYRELWYDAPPPPPIAGYGAPATVVRLGSFAKILAPGLRVGWMVADPALVRRAVRGGLLDSGGGVNHLTAHIVAAYMRLGLLDPHVAALRAAYRARRDILVKGLRTSLPPGCSFEAPGGGYFIWVRLPEGLDAAELLPRAEEAGVSYLPGALFHAGGGGREYLRLSFSMLSPAELLQGAERLGNVLRQDEA